MLDDKLVGDSQPLDMNVPFSGLPKVRTVSRKTKGGFVANEGCPVGCRILLRSSIQLSVWTEGYNKVHTVSIVYYVVYRTEVREFVIPFSPINL